MMSITEIKNTISKYTTDLTETDLNDLDYSLGIAIGNCLENGNLEGLTILEKIKENIL